MAAGPGGHEGDGPGTFRVRSGIAFLSLAGAGFGAADQASAFNEPFGRPVLDSDTDDGYLLTNFHVVEDATDISVTVGREAYSATLIRQDLRNDLALLKVSGAFNPLPMVTSSAVKLGQEVFTIGFPNPDLQGVEPKLTDGRISALTGLLDDASRFQISVPVQPGNSGGPLMNSRGEVVGVIVARLADWAALQKTGALPQNVNYASRAPMFN
jgi:S1-C subfamily serine protease